MPQEISRSPISDGGSKSLQLCRCLVRHSHVNRVFVRQTLLALIMCLPTLLLLGSDNDSAYGATWAPSINHDFPDPAVLYSNGTYFAYSTEVRTDNVPFSTSTDGVHWSSVLRWRDAHPSGLGGASVTRGPRRSPRTRAVST